MRLDRPYRIPEEKRQLRERARKLEWISIALLISGVIALGLTLGQSQTMKTAWVGDLLALIPPIALLTAMRFEFRTPSKRFPYGYFRSISLAFLITAVVLCLVGLWLFVDAVMKLVHGERPQIGTMELFGRQFWSGWAMIAALSYSVIFAFTLGHIKRPIAQKLHDKVLEADADMNRADWLSEGGGVIGILLVGFGFWWGDAVAAGLISLNIVFDGWRNLRQVLGDLMDESPTKIASQDLESLPDRVRRAAERLDWVGAAAVRLREHGHVLMGDVYVVPKDDRDLVRRIERATDELLRLDWRLYDLTISPISSLKGEARAGIGSRDVADDEEMASRASGD